MILTLWNHDKTIYIDMTADQFTRLRDLTLSNEEIALLAAECGVDTSIFAEYREDLNQSVKERIEIDSSCDYTDHL